MVQGLVHSPNAKLMLDIQNTFGAELHEDTREECERPPADLSEARREKDADGVSN